MESEFKIKPETNDIQTDDTTHFHTHTTMHRQISKAEKEMALRMSLHCSLSDTKIAKYTGIRPRTMRGLSKRFRDTGKVVKKPVVNGCPRLLNLLDAMVSASCI